MVMGGARFALAGLLLIAVSAPAHSQPLAAVAVWPAESGEEACHHAEAGGVDLVTGCLNVGPVVGPSVPTYGQEIDDGSPSATPAGDVRTSRLTLLDLHGGALGATGMDLGDEEITYLWTDRDGELWCMHLLEGAPLQPDGPAQSVCVRGDARVPSAGPIQWTDEEGFSPFIEARFVHGTNMVRYADEELAPVRVKAEVTFTYDCSQMTAQEIPVGNDWAQAYLPVAPGSGADGVLGLAADADQLSAVFDLLVEDAAGELTSTHTALPGMGQALGYALLMQQEQAGEDSDLCA